VEENGEREETTGVGAEVERKPEGEDSDRETGTRSMFLEWEREEGEGTSWGGEFGKILDSVELNRIIQNPSTMESVVPLRVISGAASVGRSDEELCADATEPGYCNGCGTDCGTGSDSDCDGDRCCCRGPLNVDSASMGKGSNTPGGKKSSRHCSL